MCDRMHAQRIIRHAKVLYSPFKYCHCSTDMGYAYNYCRGLFEIEPCLA